MAAKSLTYGLTHIAISLKDLERTKKFYQGVFDMEVMYDKSDFLQLTTPGAQDILVFEKHGKVQSRRTGSIAHFGFRMRKPQYDAEIRKRILQHG